MALRWSRVSPVVALSPAVAITAVAFAGAILWTIYASFTRSRKRGKISAGSILAPG